ncbi:AMP-binding protein [Gordonia sp. HY002]|uniref:class I adenylate-forming enzyme family protein n=1 Tax=Gordonia zhenghanii TaxID=2911516 RepID=UPI001EEFE748|nr:AMP-binding protein [Gordonia zhenghanii]MCF8571055.1 AMP-binding protein [Gordonia zhenghanii]MCF8606399.1 AMP-binding protein [Gordonia zhenghanii]
MPTDYLPWERPEAWGASNCVRDDNEELTYDEFAGRVIAAAEHFTELGIGRGSVVAIMLPNRIELLTSIVAAWRLGAAATPINPVFTDSEANYQINDAGADLVIVADESSTVDGKRLPVGDLRTAATGTPADPAVDEDGLALLIYTSGSTGRPKGVRLTHHNVSSMASMMDAALRLTTDDHCLLVLPLFHVNAICVSFLSTMLSGGQLSILSRFHPVEFLKSIERLKPTYFSAVPTIYAHLLALPDEVQADTSSVRFGICGAAPASTELLAGFEERYGFPLLEAYGLTECTCGATSNPIDGVRKPGTVGIALPGQTVGIMGPDGTLLPAGERGEVVLRGDNVMQGYLDRPDATAETLADGWLHTGDVGILDEDGYLSIVDRIKDMIIRGGENIYPKEIETVLAHDPAVMEVAVVGRDHPVYGEVPVAFVALNPGRTTTVDDLRALCAQHLTKVKVPVEFLILDSLPKNPVGKLDKPTMRTQTSDSAKEGD